jgi:preprotein translocase subunit YajC
VQTVQSLIFLVLLIGIFYFMLIRPQKKRVQQHQNLLSSIGVGDEIVTIGGMHGIVRAIGDEDVEIEAAPGVTMRFVKNAIARRVTEELDDGEATSATPGAEPAALETPEDEKS